jgi:hypothetical protein
VRGAALQQRLDLGIEPGHVATFDPVDPRYRYLFAVKPWSAARPATFIMLNGSKAGAADNSARDGLDPTVRRCVDYARQWGCGGLLVANLFGRMSTDPDELLGVADPVGRENDRHILGAALAGSPVICAWGSHKAIAKLDRQRAVLALLRGAGVAPMCLRQTDGRPHHPLYLPASLKPEALKESK